MCGINGIYAYHYAANPVDHAELVSTRDHMAARGPDGKGEWFSADGRVAFGHRRLSTRSVRCRRPTDGERRPQPDGDLQRRDFQVREDKRPLIPAVTHVDGSGRLQTVHQSTNSRYWRLIDAFRALTGVPMLLNTSFNENEPVVCRPEEALECFLRTEMDVLVLGNSFVSRKRETWRS
jgi:Carbamoyltransferase C-terminus